MILIENEKTYSYDDVCLVPTYSDLDSRSEADISMGYYTNPMVNAPMVHTSSANMLRFMVDNYMCPTVHRYFKNSKDQFNHVYDAIGEDFKHVFFSVGRNKDWINQLHKSRVSKYCVDMAHGDSKPCVETVIAIKKLNPHAIVMAGNVATHAGYVRLREAGADYIRVGIAGGCFTGDMLVNTPTGNIKISDFNIGDTVITHTGDVKRVTETMSWLVDEEIVKINGIASTKNHEYYVVDKKYKDILTDDNIHEYASWIPASELNENLLLINHV